MVTPARRAAWNWASSFRFHRKNGSTYASCVRDLVELRDATDAVLDRVIVAMREDGEYSFQEIGDALGVSRQAATKRYQSVTEHIAT